MSPRRLYRLTGLVCAALLASACSSEPSEPHAADPSTPTPVTTTAPTPDRSTPAATAVLRFTAPRLGGGTIDGEDFAGRDVAFWFWAPW